MDGFRVRMIVGLLPVLLAAPAAGQLALQISPLAQGLERPLIVTHAGDGSGRLFIGLQPGRVLIFAGGTLLATPFLDLGTLTSCCGEQGLLGLAFHPQYAANGLFFVGHTQPDGDLVIARYSVSAGDPNLADPNSRQELLEIAQPFGNHNGGHLVFGPDGYLYVGSGDGGSGGDPQNNGQNLSTLLGKLLRIDIDSVDPGLEYAVPPSNPFVGVAGVREEIWAWGLRNPWRFSFDRSSGDLWLGDVGQNAEEEVDFQPAASPGGENYGWRRMEGNSCFQPPSGCSIAGLTPPVFAYSHTFGCSVTGGFRYRGDLYPRLRGVYLYGDFCFGTVWGSVPRCDGVWESRPLLQAGVNISTFGEDESGELYLTHLADVGGAVYRVALAPSSGGPAVTLPTSVSYGAVPTGTPEAVEIAISQTGTGPEAAQVAAIVVDDPSRFSVAPGGTDPCGSLSPCLPPGTSCTLTVSFSSSDAGEFAAQLSVDGNFAPRVVDLEAVAYASCPFADSLDLSEPVNDVQSFVACGPITTGPGFLVSATGRASLVSGNRVALGDGTVVAAGGVLTVTVDPKIVLP